MISARTRVMGVIGDPVVHSLSPAIHNAAYRALGLDFVYIGLPVPRGLGHDAVRALPVLGISAINVTMPHKGDAARACDALTSDAARLQAVNTVVVQGDGSLLGDSTDGAGFLAALADLGVDPAGSRVLVLGAGGAARAIVLALGRAGASVVIAARRTDAAADAAELAPGAETRGFDDLEDVIAVSDVLVNATPVGMGGESLPFDPAVLGRGHVVLDTVYHPAETPLLASARANGARAENGLGMLVGQAAAAFVRFTGSDAPLEVMRSAARTALADD